MNPSPKVEGVVVTPNSHPGIFAGNPAMQTLARVGGGNLVLSEAQFTALGGQSRGASTSGTVSRGAPPQPPASDDGVAFADAYFATKREAGARVRRKS